MTMPSPIPSCSTYDILIREHEKSSSTLPGRAPFYMVEVFTKEGTDSEYCNKYILNTTGFVPAVYDEGTH
jgi:hypothetical protein